MRGDGSVTYEGRDWVKVTGTRHSTLAPETVRALFNRIIRADVFRMPDEFDMGIIDHTSTILTVSVDDERKRVVHNWTDDRLEPGSGQDGTDWAMHDKLAELELAVDRAVDSEQWIGRKER
jgi:hypothetical protein